jgi:hypothetical protein
MTHASGFGLRFQAVNARHSFIMGHLHRVHECKCKVHTRARSLHTEALQRNAVFHMKHEDNCIKLCVSEEEIPT